MKLTKADIIKKLNEFVIKKIVNKKGQITKRKSAGKAGKKYVNGKVVAQTSAEKKNKRLGNIQKKKTMNVKSSTLKKKSIKLTVAGTKKHKKLGI